MDNIILWESLKQDKEGKLFYKENLKPLEWGKLYFNKDGKLNKYFPLHYFQSKILQSKARFILFIAGKGSGKTTCGALWLYNEIVKNPTGVFIISAPSYKMLYSSTIPAWLNTVKGTQLEGQYRESKSDYILPTGAKIWLRSMDDERCIEGIVSNSSWHDENAQCTSSAWQVQCSRVGATYGKIFVSTTPYPGCSWLIDAEKRAIAGDKDYELIKCSSNANPIFREEEFERARATLPDHKFRMYYLAETEARGIGLIYGNMRSCIIPESEMPPLETGKIVAGLDFGSQSGDATAACIGLYTAGIYYIFATHYAREDSVKTFNTLKQFQNNLFKRTGRIIDRWFTDHSPSLISSMKRWKLPNDDGPDFSGIRPALKGAGSVDTGISIVHACIRLGKLKLIEGKCKPLLDEAEVYSYPEENDEIVGHDPKRKQSDHMMDAARYVLQTIHRKNLLKLLRIDDDN